MTETAAHARPTLVITRGLPASGKTTWSCQEALNAEPGTVARVSRDEIGRMLHVVRAHHGPTENQITVVERTTIEQLLRAGVPTVIADSCNLRAKYAKALAEIGWRCGAEVRVEDFTDVSLDRCLLRDRARPDDARVGDDVIRGMHTRYLAGRKLPLPAPEPTEPTQLTGQRYEPTLGLPRALLVDVDGTVALHGDRDPYDTSRYHEDTPNWPVINMVRAMHRHHMHRIVFCSGREETYRRVTEAWLHEHVAVEFDFELHMRPAGDTRRDDIVKLELFDKYIRNRFNIVAAVDDRDRVVRAYRDVLGLPVWQVADGNF
jgi:predicted kinase